MVQFIVNFIFCYITLVSVNRDTLSLSHNCFVLSVSTFRDFSTLFLRSPLGRRRFFSPFNAVLLFPTFFLISHDFNQFRIETLPSICRIGLWKAKRQATPTLTTLFRLQQYIRRCIEKSMYIFTIIIRYGKQLASGELVDVSEVSSSTSNHICKQRNVSEPSSTVPYVFFLADFGTHVISLFYIKLVQIKLNI